MYTVRRRALWITLKAIGRPKRSLQYYVSTKVSLGRSVSMGRGIPTRFEIMMPKVIKI